MSAWSLRQFTSSVARRPAARGGVQVGVHVGAAERVDGLLGVADQHERHPARAERAPQDVPLHGIRVLELVHQHDAVARAQPGGRRGPARPAQRAVEPGEQVVVGHHARAPLAHLELLAHGLGQAAGASPRSCPPGPRAARSAPSGWPRPGGRSRAPGRGRTRARRRRGSGARRGRRRPPRSGRRRPPPATAPGSTSPATPEPASTSWQKPCVVAMVAASKAASARARRSRRARTASGAPCASSRTTPSPASGGAPARARSSPCSAETSRSRTRSRSSPVAMRVNVTSRSRSSGIPSAT